MRRLHLGLRSNGIQSRLLVREGDLPPDTGSSFEIDTPEPHRLWAQLGGHFLQHKGVDHHRTAISNTTFNLPISGYDLSHHPEVLDADVINLHWPTYVLSNLSLRHLIDLGKPVFWTIHDQWAFTGGCHYSAGCRGYVSDCTSCPQLSGECTSLASAVLREKKKLLDGRGLEIIAPSKWIARCAEESALFRNQPVHWVANGIEHEVFRPQPQAKARKELGLPEDNLVLLFGADHLIEIRKGWSLLRQALVSAARRLGDEVPICLAFFGEATPELTELPIAVFPLGYLNDDEKLTAAYNAADLFLLPSLEDNQPNTMMEAMACGTPVAGFSVGALPDIVSDGENGFLAPVGDAEGLGDAIVRLARLGEERSRMAERARQCIVRDYTLDRQASGYSALYEEALSRPKTRRSRNHSTLTACTFEGSSAGFRKDAAVLRPLGQLLKAEAPAQPVFDPGWTFGRRKEKRRVEHYLRSWMDSLPPGQRFYISDAHGIYDFSAIALGAGFRIPEGPYPEMNLPWPLVWAQTPKCNFTLVKPSDGSSCLQMTVQTSIDGLALELCGPSGTIWQGELPAILANPELVRTELSIPLPSFEPHTSLSLEFTPPVGAGNPDNLAIAVFALRIDPAG